MNHAILHLLAVLQLGFRLSSAFVIEADDVITAAKQETPRSSIEAQKQHAPEVVFRCGFRSKFRDLVTGNWVTDKDVHATCMHGKLDILKYCRKAYPELKINNIVDAERLVTINDWCKADGGKPCKWSFSSKPYRCLVGEYESEALLVPRGCHFGHKENRTLCESFDFWNRSAQIECSKRLGDLHVQSFAMLEPCGLDMFSGVEFVCCPKKSAGKEPDLRVKVHLEPETGFVRKSSAKSEKSQKSSDGVFGDDFDDESDDDDDEEEGDDEEDEDSAVTDSKIGKIKIVQSTTPLLTTHDGKKVSRDSKTSTSRGQSASQQSRHNASLDGDDEDDGNEAEDSEDFSKNPEDLLDVYFKVVDPENEHDQYRQALDRLEKGHKDKISDVMKEWSELETRYQEMLTQDPKHAQVFRHNMTSRFRKTVDALEGERKEQRRQIEEVHEQRVDANSNERGRERMREYRKALAELNPSEDRILDFLEKFVKIEEKARYHSLNRFKHLHHSDPKRAEDIKLSLLQKLGDIDLRINNSIEELNELKPELKNRIKSKILHFWSVYRAQNTPDIQDESLVRIENVDYSRLLEIYKNQNQAEYSARKAQEEANKIAVDALTFSTVLPKPDATQNIVDLLPARWKLAGKAVEKVKKVDESDSTVSRSSKEPTKAPEIVVFDPVVDIAGNEDGNLKEEKILDEYRPFGAYAKHSVLQHQSPIIEQNMYEERVGGSSFLVLGLAGAALMACLAVGVLLMRRRSFNRRQGFVEVDACTPEERHVSLMQGNGYENPTYKYFDDKI